MDEWISGWIDLCLPVSETPCLYLSCLCLFELDLLMATHTHEHTHTHTHTFCIQNWWNESWSQLHNFPGPSLNPPCPTLRASPLCSRLIFCTWFWSPLGILFMVFSSQRNTYQHWGKCIHGTLGIQVAKCQAFVDARMWKETDHADKLLYPASWTTPGFIGYFRFISWSHWYLPLEALKHLILSLFWLRVSYPSLVNHSTRYTEEKLRSPRAEALKWKHQRKQIFLQR